MYIKTISNFLKDIEFLKCSFNESCVKYGRRLKTLDDYFNPDEQLNAMDYIKATTDYLEYLNAKKNTKIKLFDENIQEVKCSIIWKLIEYTYKKTVTEIVNNEDLLNEYKSEIASWIFSLPALANILMEAKDENKKLLSAQIVLEGQFYYGDRIDVSIIGKNRSGDPAMVLIENKRWSNLKDYELRKKDNNKDPDPYVKDPLYPSPNHKRQFILHPCKQVKQYKDRLENVNGYIQDYVNVDNVYTAVYLLNPKIDENEINEIKENGFLKNDFKEIISNNPVFYGKNGLNCKEEEKSLPEYIISKISAGHCVQTANKKIGLAEAIYGSKVKFSKKYSKFLYKLSEDEHIEKQIKIFDVLLDEKRKACIDDIIEQIRTNENKEKKEKKVFIIKGAAGTGKSFMGLALLAYLVDEKGDKKSTKKSYEEDKEIDIAPLYLIKCLEPRTTVNKQYNVEAQYSVNGNEIYDCIICDDAQRYQKIFSQTDQRNPLETIIDRAYVSVFFIDEHQIVHKNDDITEEKIRDFANDKHINISKPNEYNLEEQYRMKYAGLKEVQFLSIIDSILGEFPKSPTIENEFGEYEFAIADSPSTLFSRIRRKDKIRKARKSGYASRVVAGKESNWTWEPNSFTQTIVPAKGGKKYKSWKYGDNEWKYVDKITFTTETKAVDYVGCIDFCQGVNLEYVGVIIARDLVYEDNTNTVNVILDNHSKNDTYLQGKDLNGNAIGEDDKKDRIKNSYRVLLTRGERGCYIYCCNEKLLDHLSGCESGYCLPFLKTGCVSKIDLDDKGEKIKRAFISCCTDEKIYEVSPQTVNEMYEVYKKNKCSVNEILKEGVKVTFIVKTPTKNKFKKYAISLELDDPLPDKYFQSENPSSAN